MLQSIPQPGESVQSACRPVAQQVHQFRMAGAAAFADEIPGDCTAKCERFHIAAAQRETESEPDIEAVACLAGSPSFAFVEFMDGADRAVAALFVEGIVGGVGDVMAITRPRFNCLALVFEVNEHVEAAALIWRENARDGHPKERGEVL